MSAEVKPGYKQTEVGVIPESWGVCCLSDLGKLEMGRGLLKSDISPFGDIPAIPYTSLYTDFSEVIDQRQIAWFTSRSTAPYVVDSPCVLLASSSNVSENTGKASALTAGFPVAVGREVISFRTKQNVAFISYLLGTKFYRKKTLDLAKGITIRHVYPTTFINYEIALPPLVEQSAIAESLGDVNTFISGLDQLITKKRDIQQAAMQQLLTGQCRLQGFSGEWEVKRLGDIAELVMGQSPSSSFYNKRGDGLPLIQGNADIVDRKTIKRFFTSEITKFGQSGDLLLSVRAPVGEVARAMFDVCLGRGVCAIRGGSEFLYHYLISIESSWARLSKGSTFDSINSAELRSLELQLPPSKAEQTAIATILSDMDIELTALEARREKARQLKQGMMQELLTGRIRLI